MQINPGWGFGFVRQLFDVVPGEEVYASSYMYIEESPPLSLYFEAFLKIAFFVDDTFSVDITPASISKGRDNQGQDPFYFPGIEGLPMIVSGSSAGTWHLTQSQGVVPEGATLASVGVFNINFSGHPAPIWFDNVIFARLEPDDDGDRLENGVDSDPLNVSAKFSDGTTSGTVIADANLILSIDDAPGPDGVRITADPGGGSPARVRVCDESATLTIKPGNDLVVTCGSVTLEVEAGLPVNMEITLNGEPAAVIVPAEIAVTFTPDTDTLAVTAEPGSEPPPVIVETTINDEPATLTVPPEITVTIEETGITVTAEEGTPPVVLEIGGAEIPIAPGEEINLPSILIDIKPGSHPNCFNIDGQGVIPVAVLGSATFDVTLIHQGSLSFGGLLVRIKGNALPSCGLEDTNADGFDDLVCHFEDDEATSWTTGDAWAELSGFLHDGTAISGIDSICIVP